MSAKLAIYHPNDKGTGAAVKFALRPATYDKDGGIVVTFANQNTIGDRRAATPTFPTFDFENGITADLGFQDLELMLQVFRGETDSINDGKGIHKSGDGKKQIVRLSHNIEPVCGYSFEATEVTDAGAADIGEKKSRILFQPSEALGLCEVIAGALSQIAFGVPRI